MSELKKLTLIVVFLISVIILLTALLPQITGINPSWSGADDAAAAAISSSDYEPWFSPLWEPPSKEIESLLFSLQAAIGAGIIGYIAGWYRGRKGRG